MSLTFESPMSASVSDDDLIEAGGAPPGLDRLIARMASRDTGALAEFYDLTLGRVYALAMRVLRNAADAEEVVSDVYLQAWDKAGDFDTGRGRPMSWLLTMAWSRAVDRTRRLQHRLKEEPLHPDEGPGAYTPCEDTPPDQLIDAMNASRTLATALDVLTPAQRQVIELAFLQELSHNEIATRTGLPLGTVKSHAKRGLTALREAFASGGRP